MYDLLLKGGTVVDPSAGLDGVHDIAVEAGLIARIAPDIPSTEAARTIAVGGKVVTPGLIDLHAHVFEGVNRTGVNPDLGGVLAGVTTIVDAGSAGSATFGAFPRHIMPSCHTEIVPFLHICQTGLATMPDIIAESSINLGDTLKVLDQHKGLIAGIKARMVSPALEIMGMEMPKLARRAARESGTRLMVHIGDTEKRYDPTVIRKLLPLLDAGRHPHALLHRQSRRRARRQRQARARGARGGGSRRVVRHGPRADELQLRRRAAHHRAGAAPALHQHRPHRARDAS